MVDIDIIIASYLAGNATREELEYLKSWIREDEDNARYLKNLREVWLAADSQKYDAGKAFERFGRRIHKTRPARRQAFIRTAGIVTAAAACLVYAVVFSFRQGKNSVSDPAALANVSVSVPAGSTSCLTLPDGTTVWLNSGSLLTYHQSFGITERNLTLSGEAYFNVRHDEKLPLNVHVNGASIKDIGTKFNINAHENDDVISVSLIEGCAEVRNHLGNGREVATLKEHQIAQIDREEGRMRVLRQHSLPASEWINGALIFDDATLLTIANELSRRYGVSVMIDSEALRSTRFYLYFVGKDYSLHDILTSLQSTGKVRCEEDNSRIRFCEP